MDIDDKSVLFRFGEKLHYLEDNKDIWYVKVLVEEYDKFCIKVLKLGC
jgi:hypothetical protein